ncbi:hypothetical protein RSOLAG1IB_08852 [Rhizoctonia solani AG-1 IB]|uniref:Uncharacterized protein n=1 Tax=Thanatephorus cucumeris (strain AG1-IB / isolate 7/3/14) TaxID=1108050 RepID=A0A0B7FRG3_THACB|nr:hypothetical protein RSOLAG1IB_08852 [Rhizoctonia solani AG-1 IB]
MPPGLAAHPSSLGGPAPVAPRLGVPPLPPPSYRPPVSVVSLLDFVDYARSRPKAKYGLFGAMQFQSNARDPLCFNLLDLLQPLTTPSCKILHRRQVMI